MLKRRGPSVGSTRTIAGESSGDGYALAYREARRGLEDQERSVVELRSRAGALIAAAAITTSFFGGQTLVRHDISAVAWLVVSLGFALLLVIEVLAWVIALVAQR
jgi:hypothetical protein